MRRLRWAIILLGVLVAALAVVGWVLSRWRLEQVGWKHGWRQGPDPTPSPADPATSMWRFHAVTFTVNIYKGTITASRSEYLSLAAKPEELDNWKDWGGWERYSVPTNTIRGFPDRGRFFRGGLDWRVLGVGVYREAGRGEEAAVVEVPCWLIILGAALPMGFAWRAERRLAGRLRRGECARCGYPLPAGAPSCPECGSARSVPEPRPAG